MEPDKRPLADLLFGHPERDAARPDVDLAEVISAWFRATRSGVPDGASFGAPGADPLLVPRPEP